MRAVRTGCDVDCCDQKHYARGLCRKHYLRVLRHGSTDITAAPRGRSSPLPESRICVACGQKFKPPRRRSKYCGNECSFSAQGFYRNNGPITIAWDSRDWDEVLRTIGLYVNASDSGCHVWRKNLNSCGYAYVGLNGKKVLVHRLVMQAVLQQEIPRHVPVHHKCANRGCVNPEHLELTTARDNNAEMMSRNALIKEICDLRAALASIDPDHPILGRTYVEAARDAVRELAA